MWSNKLSAWTAAFAFCVFVIDAKICNMAGEQPPDLFSWFDEIDCHADMAAPGWWQTASDINTPPEDLKMPFPMPPLLFERCLYKHGGWKSTLEKQAMQQEVDEFAPLCFNIFVAGQIKNYALSKWEYHHYTFPTETCEHYTVMNCNPVSTERAEVVGGDEFLSVVRAALKECKDYSNLIIGYILPGWDYDLQQWGTAEDPLFKGTASQSKLNVKDVKFEYQIACTDSWETWLPYHNFVKYDMMATEDCDTDRNIGKNICNQSTQINWQHFDGIKTCGKCGTLRCGKYCADILKKYKTEDHIRHHGCGLPSFVEVSGEIVPESNGFNCHDSIMGQRNPTRWGGFPFANAVSYWSVELLQKFAKDEGLTIECVDAILSRLETDYNEPVKHCPNMASESGPFLIGSYEV